MEVEVALATIVDHRVPFLCNVSLKRLDLELDSGGFFGRATTDYHNNCSFVPLPFTTVRDDVLELAHENQSFLIVETEFYGYVELSSFLAQNNVDLRACC